MDEQKLAAALRKGERRALDRAVERYTAYLSAVVRRTLGVAGTAQDVEELVSDTFLALWRHREELQGESLRPWLAAVARNRAVDWLRRFKPPPLPLETQPEAAVPGPEDQVERREFAAALWTAVEGLPQPDKDLVVGYYLQNHSIKDLAKALALTPGAAKTRLCRARKTLKTYLTKGGAFGGPHE